MIQTMWQHLHFQGELLTQWSSPQYDDKDDQYDHDHDYVNQGKHFEMEKGAPKLHFLGRFVRSCVFRSLLSVFRTIPQVGHNPRLPPFHDLRVNFWPKVKSKDLVSWLFPEENFQHVLVSSRGDLKREFKMFKLKGTGEGVNQEESDSWKTRIAENQVLEFYF